TRRPTASSTRRRAPSSTTSPARRATSSPAAARQHPRSNRRRARETAPFVLPVKRRRPAADRNRVSLDARLPVLAAVVGVAVLALGGGFLLLGGGKSSSPTAAPVIKPLHPVAKHATTAPKKATVKKTVVAKKTAPAKKVTVVKSKPAVKPAPKPKAVAKPKHTPVVINGMPSALALALRSHSVVVVSLFTPGSSVDSMATAEARHGAPAAH